MDDARKGQIALLLVKNALRVKGVRLIPNFKREVGSEAKAIGITVDEAMDFMESIIRELVEEVFSKTKKRD